MNAFTNGFRADLEHAAEGLALGLKIESGIEAGPHVIDGPEGNRLVFTTSDTNSRTLIRYLGEIFDGAIKSEPRVSETLHTLEPEDCPELKATGFVAVPLGPQVLGYLTAKL